MVQSKVVGSDGLGIIIEEKGVWIIWWKDGIFISICSIDGKFLLWINVVGLFVFVEDVVIFLVEEGGLLKVQ